MKSPSILFLILPFIGISSCNKNDNSNSSNKIYYASINKEYVLTRDIKTISSKTDEVSLHLDSIIKGITNTDVISTGNKSFDLNGDQAFDLGFEIIDLNKFNIHNIPSSFDSLAVRVTPYLLQVLDNSTYQYADALNANYQIDSKGIWTSSKCVLGTFTDAGQFKGKGEKYLGIRLIKGSSYLYGWIKVYCSQHNDTIKIIEYAYNELIDKQILSGQKE